MAVNPVYFIMRRTQWGRGRITEQLGVDCHSGHETRGDQWGTGLTSLQKEILSSEVANNAAYPSMSFHFILNHPNPLLNIKFH